MVNMSEITGPLHISQKLAQVGHKDGLADDSKYLQPLNEYEEFMDPIPKRCSFQFGDFFQQV